MEINDLRECEKNSADFSALPHFVGTALRGDEKFLLGIIGLIV